MTWTGGRTVLRELVGYMAISAGILLAIAGAGLLVISEDGPAGPETPPETGMTDRVQVLALTGTVTNGSISRVTLVATKAPGMDPLDPGTTVAIRVVTPAGSASTVRLSVPESLDGKPTVGL